MFFLSSVINLLRSSSSVCEKVDRHICIYDLYDRHICIWETANRHILFGRFTPYIAESISCFLGVALTPCLPT